MSCPYCKQYAWDTLEIMCDLEKKSSPLSKEDFIVAVNSVVQYCLAISVTRISSLLSYIKSCEIAKTFQGEEAMLDRFYEQHSKLHCMKTTVLRKFGYKMFQELLLIHKEHAEKTSGPSDIPSSFYKEPEEDDLSSLGSV